VTRRGTRHWIRGIDLVGTRCERRLVQKRLTDLAARQRFPGQLDELDAQMSNELKRLEQNASPPLALISAPAGYGKSTLAAQWLQTSSLPGGWSPST